MEQKIESFVDRHWANNPVAWKKMAIAYYFSAEHLCEQFKAGLHLKNHDYKTYIPPHSFFNVVYPYLYAMAVELIVKFVFALEEEKINNDHISFEMFEKAYSFRAVKKGGDGVEEESIRAFEKEILPKLEEIIIWYGRYPSPKTKVKPGRWDKLKKLFPKLKGSDILSVNMKSVNLDDDEIALLRKIFVHMAGDEFFEISAYKEKG